MGVFLFLFFLFLSYFYGYGCIVYVYFNVPHDRGAQEGQKRVSDLLELKLRAVTSHHMGAGN